MTNCDAYGLRLRTFDDGADTIAFNIERCLATSSFAYTHFWRLTVSNKRSHF
ncbi:hypothetical protein [Nostoc sp.]|uniref:hypothetical protein n=1 Tax=Nostoc sp. TaxID=1180 RepID=UPI002FF69AFA